MRFAGRKQKRSLTPCDALVMTAGVSLPQHNVRPDLTFISRIGWAVPRTSRDTREHAR